MRFDGELTANRERKAFFLVELFTIFKKSIDKTRTEWYNLDAIWNDFTIFYWFLVFFFRVMNLLASLLFLCLQMKYKYIVKRRMGRRNLNFIRLQNYSKKQDSKRLKQFAALFFCKISYYFIWKISIKLQSPFPHTVSHFKFWR